MAAYMVRWRSLVGSRLLVSENGTRIAVGFLPLLFIRQSYAGGFYTNCDVQGGFGFSNRTVKKVGMMMRQVTLIDSHYFYLRLERSYAGQT